jgi:hypothetical protein
MKEENITYETCENCNGEGTVMVAKLYPNGHTEVNESCTECDGSGEIEMENPLITEAKRKYPVGTHFYPAHISNNFVGYCIVTNDDFRMSGDDVYSMTDDGHSWSDDSRFGTTNAMRLIYEGSKNHWAKTKSEPNENHLITEAKKRYPVGTHFHPAHMPIDTEFCIVTNTNFTIDGGEVYAMTNYSGVWGNSQDEKYGNTNYNRCVYYDGKWAEIKPNENPLITEAKKRYPIGTKFRVVHAKGLICTVKNHENYPDNTDSVINLYILEDENNKGLVYSGAGTVYRDGEWAEIVEESPLEICKQKYKKGMKVKCKDYESFEITENPDKFRYNGKSAVDYSGSECFLYLHGEYAEILGSFAPEPEAIKKPIEDKNKPLIEHVESVSVNLTTKNKKLTFNI